MPGPAITNQDRHIMRDVTVLSAANQPVGGGAAGTSIAYLGVVETVEISFKRMYADTTASGDAAESSRATRWGNGSVRLSGFSQVTGSKFAALFAQGGHAILSFQAGTTGDVYQLICRCEDFSTSLGKDTTKDSLTLTQEGIPFFGTGGGTPAAMVLE